MRTATKLKSENKTKIEDVFFKLQNIQTMIGNTPMLEIDYSYKGEKRTIYAKAESYNLTGSIKDRMALYILKNAYLRGDIKPGDRIIEATSGNAGIALSAIGNAIGNPVTIFMPDWMSKERVQIIKSYGAEIVLVSEADGGFLKCIELANKMANMNKNSFRPQQFDNLDNCNAHYNSTAPEIIRQFNQLEILPDAFVAGVGTGGTIMGVGTYFKSICKNIKIFPLVPNSVQSNGSNRKHRVQGISDDFTPSIVKYNELDQLLKVDDGDAILMVQKIASKLGLGIGISSAANFLGAVIAQNILGKTAKVSTVFPDDIKKYLSTDISKIEVERNTYYSCDIELLGIRCHSL